MDDHRWHSDIYLVYKYICSVVINEITDVSYESKALIAAPFTYVIKYEILANTMKI